MFYATATSGTGKASACSSTAFPYEQDSIPPGIPVLTGTVPPSPANDTHPSLIGTADPDTSIRVYGDPACNFEVLVIAGAELLRTGRVTVDVAENSTRTFYARAQDLAGNLSGCSNGVTYVEDSTPPPAPVVAGVSPTSPSNDSNPKVSGSAEDGSTVRIYTDADCHTEVGEGTAAEFASPGIVVTVANDSTTVFYATATDAAGNTSPCSSTSTAYVEDSTPPTVPSIVGTTPSSPANENAPRVFGTAEAGSVVHLYADPACSLLASEGTADQFASPGLQVTVGDNTSTTFYATATDLAGNVSGCSMAGFTYVEDSVALAPTNLATDPPSPANNNNPSITGLAEPGATVRIHRNSQCADQPAASGVANATGVFSIGVIVPDNSSMTFYADATDLAGNNSSCSPTGVTYVEDSAPPTPPILSGTSPASPSPQNSPLVLGTAEPGALVSIFTNSGCQGAPVGTSLADVSGSFAAAVTVPDNSTSRFYATATDRAQNISQCSASFATYVEDSVTVAPTLATNPTSPSRSRNPTVEGSAEPGATVHLYSAASCAGPVVATAQANDSGQFGVAVSIIPDSTTYLSALAIDLAGNVSPCSQTIAYIHEPPAPPVLVVGGPAALPDRRTAAVYGRAEAGTTVRVFASNDCSGAAVGTGISDMSGSFRAAVTLPFDLFSFVRLRASTTDAFGDTSSCSSTSLVYVNRNLTPSLAGGRDAYTCAVLPDGSGRCWGRDTHGQLGDGNSGSTSYEDTPVAVAGLENAVAITAGIFHACAVISDGTARCWGWSLAGRLGDGTPDGIADDRSSPVAVSGLTGALAITAGGSHTCALRSDGSAWCWGSGGNGELGNGTSGAEGQSSTPVAVSALTNAIAIAAGWNHTCAILAGGEVRCWGWGYHGALGDGSSGVGDIASTPVIVSGLSNAVQIAAGQDSSCALTTDGTVHCWGYNQYGQLGNADTADSSTPVAVSGLTSAVAITAGAWHSCALTSDGSVRCWGTDYRGQLGDGTSGLGVMSSTPVAVQQLSNVASVAAGDGHTCALLVDGTARCWGWNDFGQLGCGTTLDSNTPVVVSSFP
jgi:alpha-tubulin suppressor-like RCC1 family protein